jgi:hypothetical protein
MATFYPRALVERARRNADRFEWAAAVRRSAVEAAAPWMAMSDDELWSLMFGNTIKRSWMVLSFGWCPACKGGVPMYEWKIDALRLPWKLVCPRCGEAFPKNDFFAFYRSGLDERGVFDFARADRSLLFNVEHSAPGDPLRNFGVDDGEGYREGELCWRFIGTYLIYGQWKQLIVGGVCKLAAAHVLTGDAAFAHKAGILLDRVADLYPTHDFGAQGVMYEGKGDAGYVSTWHDACEETRQLVLAWDQVRDALASDAELVRFLAGKAKAFGLENPKMSWDDVRRNIEQRILQDALNNEHKIRSNYPRTPIALAVTKAVLSWPGNRGEVMAMIDEMLQKSTAVDGVTGEKGLSGYASFVINGLASFLALMERAEPDLLVALLRRHPRLRETYRFHIDTWCLDRYYPSCGDAGSFAAPCNRYAGVVFGKESPLAPSMYEFMYDLYRATGDPAYVKVLYRENGGKVDGLPHDIFCEEPEAFQMAVADVIAREGVDLKLGSVNKQEWHLAIMRAGRGRDARAMWIDYDDNFGWHGHRDGMNLGLFAKELDLMPDFGYPPVQFGGWNAPRAVWYGQAAAHNTVVVDGKEHAGEWRKPVCGRTTLWADGEILKAIRISGPEMVAGRQFERTAAMVEVSERDFYIVDVFRVVGGAEHARLMHSHFGTVETHGLSLAPCDGFIGGGEMRNFRCDLSPAPGWSVDWKIDDRRGLRSVKTDLHLRHTDLTGGAEACLADGWVCVGLYNSNEEAWIPRLITRRRGPAPLASTFVAVIEPYEDARFVAGIRRLPLVSPDGRPYPDAAVALEIALADGRRDVFIAADVEDPLGLSPRGEPLVENGNGVSLDGELCLVRLRRGAVERVEVGGTGAVTVGGRRFDSA